MLLPRVAHVLSPLSCCRSNVEQRLARLHQHVHPPLWYRCNILQRVVQGTKPPALSALRCRAAGSIHHVPAARSLLPCCTQRRAQRLHCACCFPSALLKGESRCSGLRRGHRYSTIVSLAAIVAAARQITLGMRQAVHASSEDAACTSL